MEQCKNLNLKRVVTTMDKNSRLVHSDREIVVVEVSMGFELNLCLAMMIRELRLDLFHFDKEHRLHILKERTNKRRSYDIHRTTQ